jgi:hypothetical protein
MLDTGAYATIYDLAKARGVNATYASRVLRLTLLAPDIVEAVLDGRQPAGVRLEELMEGFPVEWEGQKWALSCTNGSLSPTPPQARLS